MFTWSGSGLPLTILDTQNVSDHTTKTNAYIYPDRYTVISNSPTQPPLRPGYAHLRDVNRRHPSSSMTVLVTRTPLHNLSMTGAQTNGIKRKSLRHAHDPDEDAPPTKKPKAPPATKNASQNTSKTKSKRGEFLRQSDHDAHDLMRMRPAYDEEDDGFSYSRARTRKSKAKAPVNAPEPDTTAAATSAPGAQPAKEQPPPADENAPTESAQPPRKKPRKTLPTTPEPATRRRSKRLSGNSPVNEQNAATSRSAPAPSETQAQQTKPTTPPPAPVNDENAPPANHSPAVDQGELTVHKKRGPAKIPLPFGETPVLRRNKEMRKLSAEKSRRSSSGMRGRRASSLIETGSSRGTWIFSLLTYLPSFVFLFFFVFFCL